uniref:BZIP domain-containing protein n=1 Tax=Panagrolaimus sp. ES5 TaxID=591445 RepID=A0AC34GV44_9BILA
MVRIYCLSSIDKIKIESPETLVNDNVEDYYSTAQWDNDGISTAEKIRQNFQILESFQLTEISIGYDFINETDEKVYLMFIFRQDIGLLVIKMVIKNTKTRGVIGEEEKEYYERYANKIEAFCNGDKYYRNNGVVRSELRHGDDDPEKSQLICKLEKNETKVVTHVLERKNSIENHQHKIQKAFTKDNNIMLESADNKMTTKIDVAQSACLNPSRSLINSVPINVESCASYNNNIDLSFNQPNQLSYNIPSILNFQQPSNLQLNSFCNIQNMIPFLSQPPNLHTINPAINGFNQIQLNPSHFTQSSLFNYNNNQPINTDNIVSPQFINEMTDNPDKSVKQSCDNISCESSSTSNKNSNNPSISAPQIFNFSDTNLSQAVCHQHNSPIIVENKNNKEHPSNSTKTFSISTLNTKRGRPKIYQNDKNRKEARLKSSKKYNEKRSLQSVTIKAELDAAITVLEMENETLKNKMEAVKNTAKEFLKLHKTLILEMDKNSLKLIT